MDSANSKHLNANTIEELRCLVLNKSVWNKIRLGLKPQNKFMCKMYIQSMCSMRAFFVKLDAIMNPAKNIKEQPSFAKLFTSQLFNMMLRDFWVQTSHLAASKPPELPAVNGFNPHIQPQQQNFHAEKLLKK